MPKRAVIDGIPRLIFRSCIRSLSRAKKAARLGGGPPTDIPHAGAVELALAANLVRPVRLRRRIVALPPRLLPSRAAVAQIDGGLVEDCFVPRTVAVRNAGRNHRAAAPYAFGIERCFFLGNAGLRQRTDDSARGAAGNRAQRRRGEPSGRDHRTQARNGHQSKARELTGCAAETVAHAGPCCITFGTIVDTVAVAIDFLVCAVPVVRIVRDDAHL
jgi:hypothetical protein